jgi:hypothetical protein
MKDDIKDCITDIVYAKMRGCQESGFDSEGCRPPHGCMTREQDYTHMGVYTGVIPQCVLKLGAR